MVIRKYDKQGLPLIHTISLLEIEADLSYKFGIYCSYKAPKLEGLLWASYLNCTLLKAKRVAYLLADHFDFAPLWAKYRSGPVTPIRMYWQMQTDRILDQIDQLQKSAIISLEATEEPSGLSK